MRGQLFPPFSMTYSPSLDDYDAGDCVTMRLVRMRVSNDDFDVSNDDFKLMV